MHAIDSKSSVPLLSHKNKNKNKKQTRPGPRVNQTPTLTHMNKRIRLEKSSHLSTPHSIQHGRLQVNLNTSRDILLVPSFFEVNIEFRRLNLVRGREVSIVVKTVLLEEIVPESSTELITRLTDWRLGEKK